MSKVSGNIEGNSPIFFVSYLMRLVIIDLAPDSFLTSFSPHSPTKILTIPSLYKVLVELSTEANIRGNCCIIITFEGHVEKFVCLSCAPIYCR